MISGINIFIKQTDWINISAETLSDDFPEYFEEQLKGEGYFEYQVKSFTFSFLTTDVTPQRYDAIKIVERDSGNNLFYGFVDETETTDDDLVLSITIMPSSVLLKDEIVGTLINDGTDEDNYLFETEIQHIRDTVSSIVSQVNNSNDTGIIFTSDIVSIPEGDPPLKSPYIADILRKEKKSGFFWSLLKIVMGIDAGDDIADKYHVRNNSGVYYLVERSSHVGMDVWFRAGAWVNLSFSWGFTLFGHHFGFNFGFIRLPLNDFSIPTLIQRYTVERFTGSGLQHEIDIDWSPMYPFLDSVPSLGSYGSKSNPTNTLISTNKIISFLRSEGYVDDIVIINNVPLNSRNSFVLCTAIHKDENVSDFMVLIFQTAFDDEYSMSYYNSSAMDILKDISKVSNRYLYVSPDNIIYLLPKGENWNGDTIGTVEVNREDVAEMKLKKHRESDTNIDINRYAKSDGSVTSYGIKLRKNEYEAIKQKYNTFFSKSREERTIKFIKLENTAEVGLLNKLILKDGEIELDYGNIIERRHSFHEPIVEVIVEKYV